MVAKLLLLDNGPTFNGRHRAGRLALYQNAKCGAGHCSVWFAIEHQNEIRLNVPRIVLVEGLCHGGITTILWLVNSKGTGVSIRECPHDRAMMPRNADRTA
jgi:hypothetical protein